MGNYVDEFKKAYDEYEIISSIGRDTWQIRLKSYDKIAILKRIDNPDVYKKLQSLKISGVPTIYNVFDREGVFYVIEEYINGSNLDDVIASRGSLSAGEVKSIVVKLCTILAAVHSAGLVHRDIKPSNIILTTGNEVYLIDFGIAREQNADASKDTRHLGTEFYASPEQYGFAQTDNKSDIYSIGKLMLVLLTGKENADSIKGIPYSRIIARCIEVDSTKRYADVKALKAAFGVTKRLLIIAGICTVVILAVVVGSVYSGTGNTFQTQNYAKQEETLTGYDREKREENENSAAGDNFERGTETLSENTEGLTSVTTAEDTEGTTSVTTAENTTHDPAVISPQTENSALDTMTENATEMTSQDMIAELPVDDNGYITDALFYDGNIYSGYIYYTDISNDNPYMEVYGVAPKQTGKVQFADDCSADVYADLTDTGLNITLNNKTLFLPNTDNVSHYPNTELEPTTRIYVLVFSDFDQDGTREIFAVEEAFYEETEDNLIPLYSIGRFVRVNKDSLEMTLCSGEEMIMDSGEAEISLWSNSVLVSGCSGMPFVTYELRGNEVIKYAGLYEPGH